MGYKDINRLLLLIVNLLSDKKYSSSHYLPIDFSVLLRYNLFAEVPLLVMGA